MFSYRSFCGAPGGCTFCGATSRAECRHVVTASGSGCAGTLRKSPRIRIILCLSVNINAAFLGYILQNGIISAEDGIEIVQTL